MRAALGLLVSMALLASGCGSATDPAADEGWTRAADPPLSARYDPLLAWAGSEVLAFGGHTGPACPPSADCAVRDDGTSDGAAYDPETDAWRAVTAAPVEVDRFTAHVVVDGDLVLGGADGWWTYDADADAWTALPPGPASGPESALDGLVYGRDGRWAVQVLDLAAGTWSSLPVDPLEPRLRDGWLVATDAGVVLSGVDYAGTAPDEPTLTQADVWDGSDWRRLPVTAMIGPLFHWTGERLVNPSSSGADGGEVNGWDRWYPDGGRLDPATGVWTPLSGEVPEYADAPADAWVLDAAEGPRMAVGAFLYDDAAGTWTPLGRPDSPIRDNVTSVWAGDRLVTVGGTDADLDPVAQVWVRTFR